jgi:hypothetical protein
MPVEEKYSVSPDGVCAGRLVTSQYKSVCMHILKRRVVLPSELISYDELLHRIFSGN